MYYRRKILLAIIKTFGGSLSDTDCNKLVFLFCQRTERHYYDFIPYRFGPFSYVLFQDKLNLARLGHLVNTSEFELIQSDIGLPEVAPWDQDAILALKREVGTLRGKALIRTIYQEFPYFATRSEIAKDILPPAEGMRVARLSKKSHVKCLFSIGYEGLSIDAYLNRLIANNVSALIDVRKNPLSMKYGFSKSQLQKYAENSRIAYYHIPALGIPSYLRQNLTSPQSYADLFSYYETSIIPNQLDALDTIRALLDQYERVALTCFEADHTSCHRHKIVEYFERDATFFIPSIHL